jgi:hypothetical protein
MLDAFVEIIAAIAFGIIICGVYLWYLTRGSDGPGSSSRDR